MTRRLVLVVRAAGVDGLLLSRVPPNKGGRPRRERTIVVNVRLPISVYDAYCRAAYHAEEPVRTLLRQVLTQYMPAAAA